MHPPLAPRLTKIVATIGPACDDPTLLETLLRGGVNVARINLSHGTHAEHAARIARVRDAAARVDVPVAILIDTKGPEVRSAPLAGDPIELAAGDAFLLAVDGRPATRAGTSVTFARLLGEVPVGTTILIDDGGIELRAVAVHADAIACEVVRGGELGGRKSVHVLGVRLSLEPLSDADRADLRFAVEQQGDWIAASFVREAEDVHRIRAELRRHGGEIPIVAKIEDPDAVANLASILDAADGAMVARGDLGVLLPVSEVPLVQKRVIRETVLRGKPVITATQMLDSMERNPRPTRAEASDVANAIFDGTSAVMLSGETAKGRYPAEAVHMMVELAREAERALADYGDLQRMTMPHSQSVTEAVAEVGGDARARGVRGRDREPHRFRLVAALRREVPPAVSHLRRHRLAARAAAPHALVGRDAAPLRRHGRRRQDPLRGRTRVTLRDRPRGRSDGGDVGALGRGGQHERDARRARGLITSSGPSVPGRRPTVPPGRGPRASAPRAPRPPLPQCRSCSRSRRRTRVVSY